MNETKISTPASSFQIRENRVIRAADLFAEGALLLEQESFDLINLRHAVRLRLIFDRIQRLVPALQRLGGATKPDAVRSVPQFVPGAVIASREAAL